MARIIIDTDIGTDVDDLWTLAMVPGLDLDLAGVTVVYGDVDLRARLATVALRGMNLDVPVRRGRREPMSGAEILWPGHEGEGVPGIDDVTLEDGDAVTYLVEEAAAHPGDVHVVAIGPLTNLAAAIQADPAFAANLGHLTVMGGEFSFGWREHNFGADAAATDIVLGAGIPMTIMPLDQTMKVFFTEVDALAVESEHPLGPLLTSQARTFWSWFATIVPGSKGDASPAHDPAALLTLTMPEAFTFRPVRLDVSRLRAEGIVSGEDDASSTIRVVSDLDAAMVKQGMLASLGVT